MYDRIINNVNIYIWRFFNQKIRNIDMSVRATYSKKLHHYENGYQHLGSSQLIISQYLNDSSYFVKHNLKIIHILIIWNYDNAINNGIHRCTVDERNRSLEKTF